ncbi:TonB-dependent receptor domain-containing protein [Delftia acidovorans]|uniref:TonB-dependent receptor domain-containing protein n=1 Tax=Delftia acidovorans TaxID=80866 RepID=UPI0035A00F0F
MTRSPHSTRHTRPALSTLGAALACTLHALPAHAADAAQDSSEALLAPVVITASQPGAGPDLWRATAAIDSVEGAVLRDGQMQINLSESLARVPGLVVLNRQNFAQDLQISVRGFGARSTFGVRGLRLYVDGIPAGAPDGQGQAANFTLGNAARLDVVRGPAAVLYGNSAGGALLLYTEDGEEPGLWRSGMAVGPDGLWRLSTQLRGTIGGGKPDQADGGSAPWRYAIHIERFATDGMRPQSAADRSTAHMKLSRKQGDDQWLLQYQEQRASAQDPLGLTRAEFEADPGQTTASALRFNTRKSVRQRQLGAAWQHQFGAGQRLELMAYAGTRSVLQYQSIPMATQAPPSHSGGVIDLDRDYAGMNLRWRSTHEDVAGGRLDWSAGLAYDWQGETRRGYENFIGSQLGVQGRLRRDERNQARSADPYLQAEWSTQSLGLSAGQRQARVRYRSEDHYIAAGNGDDSGSMAWRGWLPSLGLRVNLLPDLVAHASVGRGMETPTLNEVAYRPGGQNGMNSGLNTGLAASAHNTVEVGLRGRHGNAGWNLTLFETHTQRELTVLSNTGGRATYQNAGRTLRRGLEFSGNAQWGPLTASTALTLLQARYRDSFLTCEATPCTTPTAPVDAGARLAGTAPRRLWSELAWQLSPQWTWTVDMLHSGPVAVNDRNTDRAAGYTVWGSSLRWSRQWQQWSAQTFVRLDNLFDRRFAGSVIVNEGNQRFFEPGAGRGLSAGVTVSRTF